MTEGTTDIFHDLIRPVLSDIMGRRGLSTDDYTSIQTACYKALEAAVREEREACARLAEDFVETRVEGHKDYQDGYLEGTQHVAAAIRARAGGGR